MAATNPEIPTPQIAARPHDNGLFITCFNTGATIIQQTINAIGKPIPATQTIIPAKALNGLGLGLIRISTPTGSATTNQPKTALILTAKTHWRRVYAFPLSILTNDTKDTLSCKRSSLLKGISMKINPLGAFHPLGHHLLTSAQLFSEIC
jgi:hypothetical protein